MPTRVAINGFGRIGRQAFKIAARHPGLEVVAINDIASAENLAYLLKYDTVYGREERDHRRGHRLDRRQHADSHVFHRLTMGVAVAPA